MHLLPLALALAAVPEGLTVAGSVEVYGSYNLAAPEAGVNAFRGFDSRHGSITLQNVTLDAAFERGPVQARLALQVGHAPATYFLAEPPTEGGGGVAPTGPELFRYVQQAWAGYELDVAEGLLLQGGVFLSPVGPEGIAGKDAWLWSRSNLFYALPFYHSGGRATLSLPGGLAASLMACNGWNAVVDGNPQKSGSLQVTWSPDADLSAAVLWFGGVERSPGTPESHAIRHLFDAHATVHVAEPLWVQLHVDGGLETGGLGTSKWLGSALAARVHAFGPLYVAARGDWLRELPGRDGDLEASPILVPSGWLASGTGGVELPSDAGTTLHLEVRRDEAGGPLFFGDDAERDDAGALAPTEESQDTVTLGVVAWF